MVVDSASMDWFSCLEGSACRALVRSMGTAAAALFVGFAAACSAPVHGVRVVLITLDTLRYDAFAGDCGPSALPRTSEWACRATSFTRAYSASNVTQPTLASLFTALQPWEHGVIRNGQVLPSKFETVTEVLSAAGFRTGAVVASFPLQKQFGFAQGFDTYREVFRLELVKGLQRWEGAEVPAGAFYSLADDVTEEALSLLDELGGDRQFLWFHFFDAHDPYGDTIGQPLTLTSLQVVSRTGGPLFDAALLEAIRLYHADLASLDTALARLLERIDRDAERFETHIVLTADHGESFGEDGQVGHGYSLGLQEIRVPLVIASPRFRAGVRADVVGSIDVGPTLLSLAGAVGDVGHGRDLTLLAPDGGGVAFGMQLSPEPDARQAIGREHFFAAQREGVYAGTSDGLKRVDGDPDDSPDAHMRRLRDMFGRFESAARQNSGEQLRDQETLEALEALGYVR